jgi:hypothetical protein
MMSISLRIIEVLKYVVLLVISRTHKEQNVCEPGSVSVLVEDRVGVTVLLDR